jgi:hypothetical protein
MHIEALISVEPSSHIPINSPFTRTSWVQSQLFVLLPLSLLMQHPACTHLSVDAISAKLNSTFRLHAALFVGILLYVCPTLLYDCSFHASKDAVVMLRNVLAQKN